MNMNPAAENAPLRREPINPLVWFFIIAPIAVLAVMFWVGFHPPWTPLRIAALVAMVGGFVLLTVARLTLGNSFSIAPEARKLVTHGIYSKVRNPVYVFSALGIAGFFVYIERPLLLLLLVVIIPMQIIRARAEAKVLEAKFGDEYRRYRARTWF
jgi:protein-S-isoprenylcysteine O-methyltransferase Ste14